jgi:hypothetical protein
MLLRGSSGNTGFVLEEPPDFDLSPLALSRFVDAALRQKARYADAGGSGSTG